MFSCLVYTRSLPTYLGGQKSRSCSYHASAREVAEHLTRHGHPIARSSRIRLHCLRVSGELNFYCQDINRGSGGTAGCVIARRLAEDVTKSILLVEAGKRKEEVPASAIPAAVSQILGTDADWNIQSEPCAALNNRRLHLARGKFIGGSSGCNGTICIRGVPQDYDDWGVEGWNGAQMFEDMKRVEDFKNKEWFEAVHAAHGVGGPVLTAPHDPARISSCVLESYQSKGLPLKPDMFTTGDSAQGCGHAIRSIYKGVRSAASNYIGGEAVELPNVEVITGYHVDTVIIKERGNERVAAGIVALDPSGKNTQFLARKEVIISSGAYGSPAVLLRSGIGPGSELSEVGITTRVDLPGVGKNLMDHLVSFKDDSIPIIGFLQAYLGGT